MTAGELPFKGFDPGTEFNYRFSGLLNINRLSGLESLNLLMTGRADDSARVLQDRLRSLRAFDEQNELMQMMRTRLLQEISTDLGILVGRTVSQERLSDLDRALSEIYPADALERTIRGAALWWHQQLRSMWEGRGFQRFATVIGPSLRPLLRHHAVMRLQTASAALAAAQLPWPDRINAMNGIPERRSMAPEIVPFVAAWREASQVRDLTIRMAEGIASVRCARLVVAIERYRASRNLLPDTVTDAIGRDDEMAIDPFTGKALVYKKGGGRLRRLQRWPRSAGPRWDLLVWPCAVAIARQRPTDRYRRARAHSRDSILWPGPALRPEAWALRPFSAALSAPRASIPTRRHRRHRPSRRRIRAAARPRVRCLR